MNVINIRQTEQIGLIDDITGVMSIGVLVSKAMGKIIVSTKQYAALNIQAGILYSINFFSFSFPADKAAVCNIMQKPPNDVSAANKGIRL